MSPLDGFDQRLAALSGDRRLLLERMRARSARPGEHLAIARRAAGEPAPLSFAQQRLWFLDQFAPGNPFYNIPLAVKLPFALHLGTLERSINEIVRRHDALRTTFRSENGEPIQAVAAGLHVPLAVVDLRALPAADGEAEATRLATVEAQQPFDLERGPLIRTTLILLTRSQHVFLLSLHHIVADGWSAGIFFQELSAIYGELLLGRPSPLPDLPIQYPDFAAWQRRWLTNDVLEKQLGYWKRQLAHLPTLELQTDRPRPPLKAFRGAVYRSVIDAALTEEIRALSRREGVTLFMTLLAAFDALLLRYTGQPDIVVGSVISNRTRRELEPLIGFFVNSLVLRTDVSGDPSFAELLQRVRGTALGAYAHQDLPFELLVEELQPARDPSRNPLFQVTFQLFTPPPSTASAERSVPVQRGTAIFDLAFTVVETGATLSFMVEYDTDLFDEGTIAQLVGHFRTLLEAATAGPQRRISELRVLTAAEGDHIVSGWNATAVDYPAAALDELAEAAARQIPDAVALVIGESSMSYGELDARSDVLAGFLQRLGIGRDDLVCVCLEPSFDLVVALLAILKAGAAYVPLDSAYPAPRLAFMLRDSASRVAITHASLRAMVEQPSVRIVAVDEDWAAIASCGARRHRLTDRTPDDLAYAIYTSGSTGQPKGVMVPHRAICNHMHWMQERFALTREDRVLQRTPCSFDASVWEFFAPLLAGAQLVLAPAAARRDPVRLLSELRERGVTVLQVVPSLLSALLAEAEFEGARSLRRVFCGGEALPAAVVARFHERLPGRELCNLYGPTEAAIDSLYWVSDPATATAVVPIGRPIANAEAHVLDERLETVPVGVPGELHIGGAGLARGYLNQPALTAERFVRHPWRPGARLYKTGDIARFRADGNVEFLGRRDHQVKLRGYRIELGEIEAALRDHPGVYEAAVLCREDRPNDKRLTAYVAMRGDHGRAAPAGSAEEAAAGLRRHVQQRLPDYMIPAVMVLDALPHTPNGKIDRAALPSPDRVARAAAEAYVAPRTAVEETLARIWSDVLRVARVGVHDDFFTVLGGHSLLGTQLLSRIRTAFGVELPLLRLFEGPTIAELASCIDGATRDRPDEPAAHPGRRTEIELAPIDPAAFSAEDAASLTLGGVRTQEDRP